MQFRSIEFIHFDKFFFSTRPETVTDFEAFTAVFEMPKNSSAVDVAKALIACGCWSFNIQPSRARKMRFQLEDAGIYEDLKASSEYYKTWTDLVNSDNRPFAERYPEQNAAEVMFDAEAIDAGFYVLAIRGVVRRIKPWKK